MKKYLPFLAILALSGLMPSEASAWYCRATSATGGWGWGESFYRGNASSIALNNCAVNTPRGYTCFIRYCTPYR
jgi:hypothetical protein